MSKGSKNNRIKDWQKYWAEYDQIFKKDFLITEAEECPNCKERKVECACIRKQIQLEI